MPAGVARNSGKSRADRNRKIRQQAFREQMQAYGVWSQILELNKKLSHLDEELDAVQVSRLRASLDSHHKMLDKFVSAAPVETLNEHTMVFPTNIPLKLVKPE